jgi:hypothetical protein
MTSCPSDEQLQGLLADGLSPTDQDAVVRHVEGCAPCQQRLARFTDLADGAAWRSAGPTACESAAEAGVLRRLKQLPAGLTPDVVAPLAGPTATMPLVEPARARPPTRGWKVWRWVHGHPLGAGLLAAGLLAPLTALVVLALLSARLMRTSAVESAAQQAELLEEASHEYGRIVTRVEQANYPVNKTVPTTPGTVPLSVPGTFLHDVADQVTRVGRTGVKARQYSDYPFPWRTDGGPRDEFERAALRRLRETRGQETVHEFTEIGGQPVVRYAQARVMQRTCVECHNSHPDSPRKDWQEGDVRGVLLITRPLGNDEARVGDAARLAVLAGAAVAGLLLGASALLMWYRRRRKPVGS